MPDRRGRTNSTVIWEDGVRAVASSSRENEYLLSMASAISRILMTVDGVGGVWTFALELARALGGYDVQVGLATMGTPLSDSQRAAVRSLDNVTLFESTYKLEWMDDPWQDVAEAAKWLRGLEATFEPDVIHLNNYVHGRLDWSAPVLVTGHSCVYSWFTWVKGRGPDASWNRYHHDVTEGLQGAGVVTAPTEFMLDALREHYGLSCPGRVIYNGRDPEAWVSSSSKEPMVLSAGRLWDEAKNTTALDACAPELSWPVYAAGSDRPPQGEGMKLQNVNVLGTLSQDELAEWMSRAAIFALPARYEPFGLTPLEAALSGCALVLGDIPSLREVWGEHALYVPPDDPELLSRTLTTLIEDAALRERMARRAYEHARCYSPHGMAEEYMALYDALVTSRTARATA